MQGAESVAAAEDVSNMDTHMRVRIHVLDADKGFSVSRRGILGELSCLAMLPPGIAEG